MKEKGKIKIAAIASDNTGVGYWRTIWPHTYMQEKYGDEFDIDIMKIGDLPQDNIADFFREYDLVVFHKWIDKACKVINLLKFMSIPTIMDIDDGFLGRDHPMYMSAENGMWKEISIAHMKLADCVTTTTPLFAETLRKYNKNVHVLPNAIDTNLMDQFVIEKKKSDRIRFGLVCGSTHMKDIELMNGINALPNDISSKIQLCLCGMDFRGTVTLFNKKTGEVTKRPIDRKESVWCRYEEFITNNYRNVTPQHREWLTKYFDGDDPFEDDSYRRFFTKNINSYAKHYENVDVLLAPLKENDFNYSKSQLKAIEAAYTDTALIASNFGPYTIDLKPYIEKGGRVNPDGNCLLVDSSKNHKQWVKYITYIVKNPDCLDVMKANLRRDICEKYSLENVTRERADIYSSLAVKG